MITLQHRFKNICYDKDRLLSGCRTLSQYMRNLDAQSQEDLDRFDRDTYVGEGFESFVEALILLSPIDKRINCINYQPISGTDMGVDGYGYGHDGEVHTVQVKYRSNTQNLLTANRDHISNFVAHSAMKYNAKHMTIFTTAKNLIEVVGNEMYMGKVRTLGFEDLKNLVDNNFAFWSQYRDGFVTH